MAFATELRLMGPGSCEHTLWQIVEKGCKVFYSPAPFDHSKLLLVDETWVLVGSTNWASRSLRLNFELNLECYVGDSEFANELKNFIDEKVRASKKVSLDQLDGRPRLIKLRDGFARLLTPYL